MGCIPSISHPLHCVRQVTMACLAEVHEMQSGETTDEVPELVALLFA